MHKMKTGRAVSILAAAALACGAGLIATVPATAAGEPTIADANASYTLGDWGTGLELSGAGFAAETEVTITLTDVHTDATSSTETTTVTTDEEGAFAETWLPEETASTAGDQYTVDATDGTDDSNTLTLTVLATAGITVTPSTISTVDLADKEKGVIVAASGFAPGETVDVVTVYGDTTIRSSETADINGTVTWHESWYGHLEAGTVGYTLTGATSGHVETASLTVTGETIITDGGDTDVPAPIVTDTVATALPKVSG